jgi:hypothetical protein
MGARVIRPPQMSWYTPDPLQDATPAICAEK